MIKSIREIERVFKIHEITGGGHCCCLSCYLMLSIKELSDKDVYTDEELVGLASLLLKHEVESLKV